MVTLFRSIGRQLKSKWGIVATLLAIFLFFALSSPYYFTQRNLLNILNNSTITVVLACGMAFVLAAGGVDLSVGSTLALTGVVTALVMSAGIAVPLAILIGLSVGAAVGTINGFFIARFNLQPFIMSLAMLSIARGLALVISQGSPISGIPRVFTQIFAGDFIVPTNVLVAIVVVIFSAILANQTRFGLYAKSIGDSEESAHICGVQVGRMKVLIFIMSGVFASIASFIFMSIMGAAEPLAGLKTEWLQAIAAPIIGGASLTGGVLSISGTVIGALILAALRSGLNLMRVQPFVQELLIGLIIIISVVIDSLRQSHPERRMSVTEAEAS